MPANGGEVVARIIVDTSTVQQQMDQVVAIIKQSAAQMSQAMSGNFLGLSSQFSAATTQMQTSIRTASAAIGGALSNASSTLQSSMATNTTATNSVTAAVNSLTSSLRTSTPALQQNAEAHRASAHGAGMNTVAIRELAVMASEFSRGDLKRMGSSFLVFARSTEIGMQAITALLGPLGLVIAGGVALAATWVSATHDQKEFNNALQLSGNAAGLTADSYQKMAGRLSEAGRVSESQAKTAILSLAKSGLAAKGSLEDLASAAIMFGRKTGEGTEEALNYFLKMKSGATRAAEEIVSDGYNLLTSAQIEEIREVERMMGIEKAQELLIKDLKTALASQADNTDILTQSWQSLGVAISNAYGQFKRWMTGTQTDSEKHLTLQKELATWVDAANQPDTSAVGKAKAYENITRIQAELSKNEMKAAREQASADENAEYRAEDAQHRENDRWAVKYRRQTELRDEELERLRVVSEQEGYSAEKTAELKSQILKRYSPLAAKKDPNAASNLDIWREQLEAQKLGQERQAVAAGQYYTKASEEDLKFWNKLLENPKIYGKERAALLNYAYQAEIRVGKATIDARKQALEAQLSEVRGNYEQERALLIQLQQQQAQNPAQYEEVQRRINVLDRNHTTNSVKEAKERAKERETESLEEIEDAEGAAKILLENGSISNAQYLAQMKTFAKQKLEIRLGEASDEEALERFGANNAKTLEKIEGEKAKIKRQSAKEINKIDAESAKESSKIWRASGKIMSDSLGSAVTTIIERNKHMLQSLRDIWNQMLRSFIKMGFDLVESWAINQAKTIIITQAAENAKVGAVGLSNKLMQLYQAITGTAMVAEKKVETVGVVTSNAAEAATGAAAAVAPTPYIGPALAAAAYAETMAMCMGALGVASFSAAGGFDIGNFEPLTQLHAREMVLPAPISDGFRNIIANQSGGRNSNDGGTTNNTVNMHIQATDIDSFKRSELDLHRQASYQLRRYGRK